MTWGEFWIDFGSTVAYILLAMSFHAFMLYIGGIIKQWY